MRILIVSYYFPPLNSVASLRPYSFAKTFADLGHDVTVLTAEKPSNNLDLRMPSGRFQVHSVRSGALSRMYSLLGINASPKTPARGSGRSPLWAALNRIRTSRGLVLLGRMPDPLDLLISRSYEFAARTYWDAVITSYAPYYCHSVGYRLKRSERCAVWIADFRDLWTRHHQFRGLPPFTLIERHLERKYLNAADLITTVSHGLARELGQVCSNAPVAVFTNGYDAAERECLNPAPAFTDRKVRLVYTGTLYPESSGLRCLLDTLNELDQQHPDLPERLEVVFAGADLVGLNELIDRRGLRPLVRVMGPQPRDTALRLQRDSHAQILFGSRSGADIPTGKLFEYISSGRPVWHLGRHRSATASQVLSSTGTGVEIGNDTTRLAQHIRNLLSADDRPRPAVNIEALRRYDRRGIATDLLDRIVELTRGRQAEKTARTGEIL